MLRTIYSNFNHCILHLELPDKAEAEFETIKRAKLDKTQEKIDAGDFNFEGAKLVEFSAVGKGLHFANFINTTFSGDAEFAKVTFIGSASFLKATFSGDAGFDEAV